MFNTNQNGSSSSPSGPPGSKAAAMLSWIAFIASAMETTVAVFIRTGFGIRYFGMQALAGMVILFMYPVLWSQHDPRPVLRMFIAYLVALAIARIGQFRRHLRGDVRHSRYSGRPLLLLVLGRCDERFVKRLIEPAMVFLIGVWATSWSEPLGSYLIFAAIGMFISANLTDSFDRVRAMDMQDLMFEQMDLADRVRGRSGGQGGGRGYSTVRIVQHQGAPR